MLADINRRYRWATAGARERLQFLSCAATAEKYLDDLEAGLERIRQQPDLLQPLPDSHPALTFYRVNKHLFACDLQPGLIVVLTVIHASMDIPNRLAELQPTLATEVELLHGKLKQSKHRKS